MLSQLSYSPTQSRKLSRGPGAVKKGPGHCPKFTISLRFTRDGVVDSRPLPEWRNRYTRDVENVVLTWDCRFESGLGHHLRL